jgi:hypothetical protein
LGDAELLLFCVIRWSPGGDALMSSAEMMLDVVSTGALGRLWMVSGLLEELA